MGATQRQLVLEIDHQAVSGGVGESIGSIMREQPVPNKECP